MLSATGSPETGLGEDLLASGLPSIFSPPACDTQQPTVRGGGGRTVQRERERGGEEGRKKKKKRRETNSFSFGIPGSSFKLVQKFFVLVRIKVLQALSSL